MKTMFLINSLEKGGAERTVLTLLYFLQESSTNPYYLFLLENKIRCEIPNKIPVILGSRYHGNNILKLLKIPFLAFKLKRFCQKNQISTIISFLERSNFTNVIARLLGSDHQCIISERNTPSLVYSSKSLKDMLNRWLIRWLYRKADQIISVSEGVRQDLLTYFGLKPAIITTIHNPYDIDYIQHRSKEEVDETWLTNNSFQTILNVGNLTKQKAQDTLLRTFARLSDQIANLRLIIVGAGEAYQKLIELAKDLNIEKYVKLVGHKDNPFSYMARADVFVLSSHFEGFPNVLIEAMICGCPVISTDCRSGPNEVIRDHHNGILIPVGDYQSMDMAIIEILKDKSIHQKLTNNAIKTIEHYRVERIAAQYLQTMRTHKKAIRL
jgi:N-acetylgalactosamine-N,N'-diacetylbacillosaminyl-diphospho-undecaprenol 4-alpha-N-acetylgalactosaminyltransferase